MNAGMNIHVNVPYGGSNHHICETIFKAFGRALDETTDKRQDKGASCQPQGRRGSAAPTPEQAGWISSPVLGLCGQKPVPVIGVGTEMVIYLQ